MWQFVPIITHHLSTVIAIVYIGKIRNYLECSQVPIKTIHSHVATLVATLAQAKYCKFVPINAHATWQPVDREQQWRPKGRQDIITALTTEPARWVWHVSVSERQRSRLCGQNIRVPFLRTVLPPEVGESARAMAATARQKRLYLHHQGEFQHKNCTLGSLNDSDYDGVGRFFVGHSQGSVRLFTLRDTIFPIPRV